MLSAKPKTYRYTLETRRWGMLEIDPQEVIHFPRGVPGFEDCKHFSIFDSEEIKPFQWLICLDNPELGFVIINPHLFRPEYAPELFDGDTAELQIDPDDQIALYAIVTIEDDPRQSTANLQGPLVMNLTKRLGKQVVVVDEAYSVKEKILDRGSE